MSTTAHDLRRYPQPRAIGDGCLSPHVPLESRIASCDPHCIVSHAMPKMDAGSLQVAMGHREGQHRPGGSVLRREGCNRPTVSMPGGLLAGALPTGGVLLTGEGSMLWPSCTRCNESIFGCTRDVLRESMRALSRMLMHFLVRRKLNARSRIGCPSSPGTKIQDRIIAMPRCVLSYD